MHSSLFRALAVNPSSHEHPVLKALLYSFCPAAARWWIAGAEPALAFDPLWAVVEQRSSGRTLREVLEIWGLGDLLESARRYVSKVEAYRAQARHEGVQAPERLPTFLEDRLPLNLRHKYAQAFERIGGWQNFHAFLRAWAFVIPDWQLQLKLEGSVEIRVVEVEFAFRQMPPFTFPVWEIRRDEKSVFGFPIRSTDETPSFLLSLLLNYLKAETWSVASSFRLLESDGRVHNPQSFLSPDDIEKTVHRLVELASTGPYPPLVAFNSPVLCEACGFVSICWQDRSLKNRRMSPLALKF